MVKRAELPDGRVVEFPDDATTEEITAAVNQLPEPTEEPEGLERRMGFLNRGISRVLGMPGDLVNLVNRAIGAEPLPIGSEAIESGFQATGVMPEGMPEQATDPMDVAFREIGSGVSALVPFGMAGRAAQGAVAAGRGGAATRGMAAASQAAAQRPVASTAIEGASIGGAAAGAAGGRSVAPEGNEAAAQALESLGALAGGLTPAAIVTGPPTIRAAGRAVRAGVDPFTRAGAQQRAAQRVQSLATDPDEAARRLTDPDIPEGVRGVMPPAERTGDPRLVALQRRLTDEDPGLEQTIQGRSQRAEDILREDAGAIGGAPEGAARQFLGQRRTRAIERVRTRANEAVNRAQQRLAEIDDASPEQQSRIVREELSSAEQTARSAEREFWKRVPTTERVAPISTRETFQDIQAEQGRLADPEDVPQLIRKRLPQMEDPEQVRELQSLRSQIIDEVRAERAKDAPNRRKIANLNRMQEAVLEDMMRAEGGDDLRTALSFSRVLNDRFTRGPIGRVLGYERRGGPSIQPGETMARTVGRGRETGGENMDAMLRALGNAEEREAADTIMNQILRQAGTDEGQRAIGSYLQGTFRAQVLNPDGTVSPSAARRFLNKHAEVLQRMPDVRQRLEAAASARTEAERRLRQGERLTRSVQQKARSRLGLYLESPPDRAMDRVLQSDNPAEAMKSLRNSARKDPTGFAEKGLKDEYVQSLLRQAESGEVTEAGERAVSGRRLRRLLDRQPVRRAGRQLLTDEEWQRLNRLATGFARIETGRGRAPDIGRPLEDLAANLLEIPARFLGARIGGQAGSGDNAGASLQMAQIGSSRAKQLLANIFRDKGRDVLTDAVQDETLFRTLLTQPTSRRKQQRVVERLNAWAGGAATQAAQPAFEEER